MTILRTEDWTKRIEWGISTAVVNVFEGETVRVVPEIAADLGIKDGKEIIDDGRFVIEAPYSSMRALLLDEGWSHARTT